MGHYGKLEFEYDPLNVNNLWEPKDYANFLEKFINTYSSSAMPYRKAMPIPKSPIPMPKPKRGRRKKDWKFPEPIQELEITFDSIPAEAKPFEWVNPNKDRVLGLFLGIAKDNKYPNNRIAIVEDWEKGLIYFSLPVQLRKFFTENSEHREVDIMYLGTVGHKKIFQTLWSNTID